MGILVCIYIYIYIYLIQHVKTGAIPCPHQPPTRGDNTVSVAQGDTATPGATKQPLPPDRILKELYIYIYIYARSVKSRDYIGNPSSFLVCSLWFKKKNAFTFGCSYYYVFTVTISYIIPQEWWFHMYCIHAENFSLSTKSNLMHITPWSEDDLRQLSNCGQWFLFLKETKWPLVS